MKPPEVLDLTVRELRAYGRGCRNREDESRRMLLWGVWHAAAWTRAKKVPSLARILRKIGQRAPVKKTTGQLLKIAEHLNALFGGKDLRSRKDD